jgi:nucleoside-diphosphate-sugar epimerase
MARYLVTGGAGFIGSSLVNHLIEKNEAVVVFDDFSTGTRRNLEGVARHPGIEIVEGDVRDLAALKRAVRKCDYVIHLAALASVLRSMKDPLLVNDVNVLGTLHALLSAQASNHVRRVVYSSSSSAYGDNPTLPKVETMQNNPLSPYAVSKIAGEDYCRMFTNSLGVETVSLRFFNVFGPRQNPTSQYAAVVPRFITSILKGRDPVIFGDGKQTRDFTYVDNVVDAIVLACQAPKAAGEVINIACNSRVTIEGLARFIGGVVGREVEPKFEKGRAGDVRHSLADIRKAQDLLGYRARVGVEEGLRLTVEWYKNRTR